ncbi:SAM-dependent methyltransferase, partial [Streptomyces sp. NPDC002044]
MCAHAPNDGGSRPETPAPGHYGTAVFPPGQAGEDERIDLGALAYDDVTL